MLSVSTFQCPNCHEYINTSMTQCRYCAVPIDAQLATAAVELQEKVNSACNSASLIRNMAGVMWLCFFLRMIPFVGLVATVALLILFFVVPIRLVYWLVRYGGIQTVDVDYKRARRNWLMALILWLLMIIVPLALVFLFAGAVAIFGK